MRKLIILLLIIFNCCGQKESQNNFCLKKIEYVNQRESLISSIVKIEIKDKSGALSKKLSSGNLKNVILYSVRDSDRKFFYLSSFATGKQFKIENDVIILPLITTLFEKDLGSNLSNQEIQKKINGDVGLIFDKDTIRVKKCDD